MKKRSERKVSCPNISPTQEKGSEHLSAQMHILLSGQTENWTIVKNSHKFSEGSCYTDIWISWKYRFNRDDCKSLR